MSTEFLKMKYSAIRFPLSYLITKLLYIFIVNMSNNKCILFSKKICYNIEKKEGNNMQEKNNKSRFKKYKKYIWIVLLIYVVIWVASQDSYYHMWVIEQRYNIDLEFDFRYDKPFFIYAPQKIFESYDTTCVYLADGDKSYDSFYIKRKCLDLNILPNSIKDKYAGLVFRDKYQEYLKKEVKPYFDECKLYVDYHTGETIPAQMSVDITVEEYLDFVFNKADNIYDIYSIDIFVPPNKYTENQITEIGDKLLYNFKNKGVDSEFSIWLFKDNENKSYQELTRYNQDDMRSECYEYRSIFLD